MEIGSSGEEAVEPGCFGDEEDPAGIGAEEAGSVGGGDVEGGEDEED